MDRGAIEETAEKLYKEAGFEARAGVPLYAMVERLLGADAVRLVPASALPGNGALARVGAQWRVFLRRDAPETAKRFVLLHELSHWALGADATEQECDALAGAMLAPRRAFLDALGSSQRRFTALAKRFGATESCVVLRFGETTGTPLALIAPATVRVRGASFAWPDEARIREIAALPKPGLRKTMLRDGSKRVALLGK